MPTSPAPAPVALLAGIGCRADAGAAEIIGLIEASLAKTREPAGRLAALATRESKADHPALVAAAAHFGVSIIRLESDALAAQSSPNPSSAVHQQTGLESIAEAAVLATGELLVEKRKSANATCAIGRLREWDH